jgi:large subunit ribosomal protein L35
MPKMKTHKGAASRVALTGTGKMKRGQQMNNHLFVAKAAKRKRRLGRIIDVSKADSKIIKKMLAGRAK